MSMASSFVKIPRERIGVLIGPKGKVKQQIEEALRVKLDVDSATGGVTIYLGEDSEDPSGIFRAKELVLAIGRGFSPERAFRLFDEEAVLQLIDLRDIVGKSESDMKRLKGRVIGREGKTRRTIEELTETDIAVYGHTIGIIGSPENVQTAREAVMMLLKGSQHNTVYRFLHRKRREMKRKMLEIWEKPEETPP